MSALRFEHRSAAEPAPAALDLLEARLGADFDAEPLPARAEHWIAWRGDEAQARLGTVLVPDLRPAPGVTGLVGWYASSDPVAGGGLLRAACAGLVDRGAQRVIGPMNGSTWHRYRFALPPGPEDPGSAGPWFPSEPRNPREYPAQLEAAGFAPIAAYESRIESPIHVDEPRRRAATQRLASLGITVRTLEPGRLESELRDLWALSLEGFADNPWYSPIELGEFLSLYRPMVARIDPGLLLLARDGEGRLVGFMLGLLDPPREGGATGARLVCKSLAVAPAARGAGLGGFLLSEARARGRERGCVSVIDALMHVDNVSRHMSEGHGSRVLRRYALYQWVP